MSYALYSIFFSPSTTNSYTGIGMSEHTLLHNHILWLFINILPSLATAFHHLSIINISQSFNFPLVSSCPPVSHCVIWHQPSKGIYTVQCLCNTLNVSLMALANWSRTLSVLKNQSFPSINWSEDFFFLIVASPLNHFLEKLPEQNHRAVFALSSHSTQIFNPSGVLPQINLLCIPHAWSTRISIILVHLFSSVMILIHSSILHAGPG